MMPDGGLNPDHRAACLSDAEMSRRREEIYRSMVAVADRRRRTRQVKLAATGTLFAVAAVAVTVGVLGSLPRSSRLTAGGNGGLAAAAGVGAGSSGVQPVAPQPAQSVRGVVVQEVGPVEVQEVAAGGRGVERIDGSKLRQVVVAERLTDEAFEQELATQGEVGTARVRGRVLVLNNNPVAEESRSDPRVH